MSLILLLLLLLIGQRERVTPEESSCIFSNYHCGMIITIAITIITVVVVVVVGQCE